MPPSIPINHQNGSRYSGFHFGLWTITLHFVRITRIDTRTEINCTTHFMGVLEGERNFHLKLSTGKTTMQVKDATALSSLEIAHIQTARQRLEDACRTKTRLRHDQRRSSSRKHWASACRHYRFLGNNWRNLFAWLFSRRCAAVQKSISRARGRLHWPDTSVILLPIQRRDLCHKTEKRWLFPEIERALSS